MTPLSAWYYLQFGGGGDGCIGDISAEEFCEWCTPCKKLRDHNLTQDLVAQVSSHARMCAFTSVWVSVFMTYRNTFTAAKYLGEMCHVS